MQCVYSSSHGHRTPFGREFETTGATRYNLFKVELEHNHFMVITGTYLEDLIAKKEAERLS